MRAILEVADEVTEWFDSSDPNELRSAVNYINHNVLFVSRNSQRHFLSKALTLESESSRNLLGTLVQHSPWTTRLHSESVDFQVGSHIPEAQTLSQMDRSRALDELLKRLEAPANPGQSLDGFIKRTIGRYLVSCKTLWITDPYLGGALARGPENQLQFVRLLLEQGSFDIQLATSLKSRDPLLSEEYKRLQTNLKKLLRETQDLSRSVSLTLFRDSKDFHNRRLGVELHGGGQLAFVLEKSANGLVDRNFRFREVTHLKDVEFKDFRSHLTGLRQRVGLQPVDGGLIDQQVVEL